MSYDEVLKDFKWHTKNHKMEVLQNDGLYRHLKFSDNGSQIHRYDLITWPGNLCYTGDVGTFVFSRIPDMFDFFSCEGINPCYWAEKVLTGDVWEFCEASFCDAIKQELAANYELDLTDVSACPIWKNVVDDVLSCSSDENEAIRAANVFYSEDGFYFDIAHYNLRRLTFRFVWACYAINFGVNEFKSKN